LTTEPGVVNNIAQAYEQTLVVRSQMGDEPAFQELLKLYGPRLLLFTQRMMQTSPEQVADVAQEIWIALYRALPGLLDVSKFRPWAFRIASREAFGKLRAEQNWNRLIDPDADSAAVSDDSYDESIADGIDLPRLIDKLSLASRTVIALHYMEGLTHSEIATALGLSVGTVKSRLAYGLTQLRKTEFSR